MTDVDACSERVSARGPRGHGLLVAMHPLAAALRHADSFYEVASVLDEVGNALDLRGFGIDLWSPELIPMASATNVVSPESAAIYWSDGYRRDPIPAYVARTETCASYAHVMSPDAFAAELARHRCDVPDMDMQHVWCAPVAGVGELAGVFRPVARTLPSRGWLRDIETVGRLVSLRFAQLGLTPLPRLLTRMTSRQLEIVRLLERGYTNAEIGAALAISDNTVKKQLKLVFASLDVANRTELAARVSRCLSYGDPTVLPRGYHHLER